MNPETGQRSSHWTFPRVMTRGRFKGRRFESQREYQTAMRESRRERTSEQAELNVRNIVRAYELLRQDGVGRARAIEIVETLYGRR